MSLVLDEEPSKTLKGIVRQCEDHLGHPLTKRVFYGDDDNTIYPKLKPSAKFYEVDGERRFELRRESMRRQSRIGNRRYFVERRQCQLAIESLRSVGKRARPGTRKVSGYDLERKN